MMPKPKKKTPKPDAGYFIETPCSCGDRIRTWILADRRDYIDADGNPVRHGERVSKCFKCWSDKTDMVAELIARGGKLR